MCKNVLTFTVLSFPTSGVHTSDILTVYISAIKALRELDPSMVILQVACQPIRKYLRFVFCTGAVCLKEDVLFSKPVSELKLFIFFLILEITEPVRILCAR